MPEFEMLHQIIYFLFISTHWSSVDGECQLPQTQEIDWTKMRGVWYEILNSGTPFDKLLSCFKVVDIQNITGGMRQTFYDENKNISVCVDVKRLESGHYKYETDHVPSWIAFLMNGVSPEKPVDPKLLQELTDMFEDETVYRTDYETYGINTRCTKDGKKFYWIISRDPHPTSNNIVYIFNKLMELGYEWNNVPLHLSGCTESAKTV
ncbi:uncharacterized protein LOC144422197 [Styela clava]